MCESSKSSLGVSAAMLRRSVALVAVLIVASWGPLAHSLRVAVSVSPDSVSSCRLVLAGSCEAQKTPVSGTTQKEKTTVRLFNVVPESLENAQPIHFDCGEPPVAVLDCQFSSAQPAIFAADAEAGCERAFPLSPPARGPPMFLTI